jgi:pimeloyl-ACP methyl ester carboxylesterase
MNRIEIATRVGNVVVGAAGDGPAVVLLHAVGHDRHDFDAIVPVIARRHRCFAVDWPGHGESEMFPRPEEAGVGVMAGVLEDVVDGLGLRRATFIGNSIGGTASIELAATKPERVRALVAVSSGGFTPHTAVTRAFCWFQGHALVRRFVGVPFARAYLKNRNEHTAAILARLELAARRPGVLAMEAAFWRSFARPENDLADLAPRVGCPTLLVWGDRDPVLPIDADGARARALLKGARLEALATGHVAFAEDPGAFLGVVAPFLAGLDAVAAADGDRRAP